MNKKVHSIVLILLLAVVMVALLFGLNFRDVKAETPQELASKHAPVLHYAGGEKFFPAPVDYIINSSVLKHRSSDGTATLVASNLTEYDLGSFAGTELFLDNKLGTLDAIATDYALRTSSLGYCSYVHVANTSSSIFQRQPGRKSPGNTNP